MKTSALVQAELVFDDPAHRELPFAPRYGDVYHGEAGAFAQARAVFLSGNGLPDRWRGSARFVVLETGFGLGNNFLATWAAWRADPQRCAQLVFVSVEKHPLSPADLARAHAHSPAPELAAQLVAAWPPATPDLHTLEFEQGQVRLLLAWGDIADWQAELIGDVDAFYLDGFAPARNEAMWQPSLFRQLARLARPGSTLATWSFARVLRDGLSAAGFEVRRGTGFASKRDMCLARWPENGRRRLPPPPGRCAARQARSALVIGAGLAGAAAARALRRDGLQVTVLERLPAPAQATSGNPAGLFHGVLHAHDGAHAQLLRAAALRAQQLLAPLCDQGLVPGVARGLLRGAGLDGADPDAMRALAARLALPASFVQVLQAAQASELAGLPLPGAQWLYPGGGWISPPALVQHWLSGEGIGVRTGVSVQRLQQGADGRWQAVDEAGDLLAEADIIVLACAHDSTRLLQDWTDVEHWPLGRRRGQITRLTEAVLAAHPAAPRPALPLASGGYLISLPPALGGGLLCGATSQADDAHALPRAQDHAHNLAQLRALTDHDLGMTGDEPGLEGRVGWRLGADDRLPLVGPVPAGPAVRAGRARLEQPRQVPRVEGLYVLTALGSRGITLAPWLGEVLAAWVSGAPMPVAASLLDAIDPARFVSRAQRRGGR